MKDEMAAEGFDDWMQYFLSLDWIPLIGLGIFRVHEVTMKPKIMKFSIQSV